MPAKKQASMSFMAMIPNDQIAHTQAQAAVMGAMLAEIECWRAWASTGNEKPLSVEKSRKRKASQMSVEEKVAKQEKEIAKLKNTLQEVRDARNGYHKELDQKKRELKKMEKKVTGLEEEKEELEEKSRKAEEAVKEKVKEKDVKRDDGSDRRIEEMAKRLAKKEKDASERERDAQRLIEKYRAKRRAMAQVMEARQEITQLCNTVPEVKTRLGKVVARWKSEVPDTGLRCATTKTGKTENRGSSVLPRPTPILPPPSIGFTNTSRMPREERIIESEVPRRLNYDE